jgi:hypothetical protein
MENGISIVWRQCSAFPSKHSLQKLMNILRIHSCRLHQQNFQVLHYTSFLFAVRYFSVSREHQTVFKIDYCFVVFYSFYSQVTFCTKEIDGNLYNKNLSD